jgi:ParB family transcriptional regulator, chromosome partitioning protein
MMENHSDKKLGRGLSALLGESHSKKEQAFLKKDSESIELIDVSKIKAGIYQPRKSFNQEELQELSDSIKEKGLIQPIVLRKVGDEDHYEIIAGERRFRATILAGLSKISAIVRKINNHEALELAIIENVQRTDLSLIEESEGYKRLIKEFSYSQEQVAKRVGKSRSHIANLLRLLDLPASVREMLDKKLISMGHARAIINSNNPEKLAKKIIEESLTVRDVEDMVRDERIEKVKNIPLLVRTESKIKFVNSEHLAVLEARFSEVVGSEVKISYNSFKNTGRISIRFDEFEKIQELIDKLANS